MEKYMGGTIRTHVFYVIGGLLVFLGVVDLIVSVRRMVIESYRYEDTYLNGSLKLSGEKWREGSLIYDEMYILIPRVSSGHDVTCAISFEEGKLVSVEELSGDYLEAIGFEKVSDEKTGWKSGAGGPLILTCSMFVRLDKDAVTFSSQSINKHAVPGSGMPIVTLNGTPIRLTIPKSEIVEAMGSPTKTAAVWNFP